MLASPVVQSQGLHHITLNGADKQTSIDFWEGILGMPFIFEQPNLDNPDENHLYFDPGDSRLITIFTDEKRINESQKWELKLDQFTTLHSMLVVRVSPKLLSVWKNEK